MNPFERVLVGAYISVIVLGDITLTAVAGGTLWYFGSTYATHRKAEAVVTVPEKNSVCDRETK